MTETVAHGYSSARTLRKLSNEYQHDRVMMVFKNLCVLVLWTKVASVFKGLHSIFYFTSLGLRVRIIIYFIHGTDNWLLIAKWNGCLKGDLMLDTYFLK